MGAGEQGEVAEPGGLFVPGRIEVLGKHTDYAGGSSLTLATEQGLRGRWTRREGGRLDLHDRSTGEAFGCGLPPDEAQAPEDWSLYPWTLARRVARDLPELCSGASIEWTSDLPRAAGLSSSSALLTLLFLGLAEASSGGMPRLRRSAFSSPIALAGYLAAVESGRSFAVFDGDAGVGTRGGASDHTAILCARRDHLGLYAYDPHRSLGHSPLPEHLTFAVGVSGVVAQKTGNAAASYARATRLAERAAQLWRTQTGGEEPHLGAMLRGPGAREVRRVLGRRDDGDPLQRDLLQRFEHFALEEGVLLPEALAAFRAGDWPGFGSLVDRSQRAAEELLGNQVAETVALQRGARAGGALAASAFGAGFGGAVWALVDRERIDSFLERWAQGYAERYPGRRDAARFFHTRPGGPARSMTTEGEHTWT